MEIKLTINYEFFKADNLITNYFIIWKTNTWMILLIVYF